MKLILHIGAHKTGSTALQQFLFTNPEPLAALGFHYAASRSTMKASAIAHALNLDEEGRVHDFLTSHINLACRKHAHTLIISAESFYGMTLVPALCRRQSCPNFIDQDHVLMKKLLASLSDHGLTTKVVCYLRRPDHFAESWYNQQVKYGSLFSGDFTTFLASIYPALLYNEYMSRWTAVFGKENCSVRIYESVRDNIVRDFMANILDIDDLAAFHTACITANERLSRDVLEFKRIRNKNVTYEEMKLEHSIFVALARSVAMGGTERDQYQAFLSPDERAELLADLEHEMAGLQSSFDVPPFPRFDAEAAKASWRPYPGLAPAHHAALERQYRHVSKRPRFRLERAFIRMRTAVQLTRILGELPRLQKIDRMP